VGTGVAVEGGVGVSETCKAAMDEQDVSRNETSRKMDIYFIIKSSF
jgi:hypothetical protein